MVSVFQKDPSAAHIMNSNSGKYEGEHVVYCKPNILVFYIKVL